MKRALAAVAAALSYFTILPVGRFVPSLGPDADALAFWPLVGMLVGALAGVASACTWLISHRIAWSAIVAWIAAIVLTGAIHVDGFLDACDGVLATAAPQRRLEIMRDPRHGTYAVVGMAVLSVAWIAALVSISPLRLALVLAFTEGLARVAALANAYIFPYARPGEATRAFAARPNPVIPVAALAIVCALGIWIGAYALAIVPVVIAAGIGLGAWIAPRLGGGLTGDCYGAIVCVCNAIALAIISAVSTSLGPGRFM